MTFEDFIERFLYNRKGYKYHTYQTEFEDSVFILKHHGTVILKVDLDSKPPKVIYHYIHNPPCNRTLDFSVSDSRAIFCVLWKIGISSYYERFHRDLYYSPARFKKVYLNLRMLNYDYNKINEIIKKYNDILYKINKLNRKLSYYTVLRKANFITECLIKGKISEIEKYLEKAEKYIEIGKKAQKTIEYYRRYYKDRTHIIGTLNGIYVIQDEYLIFISENKLDVYYKYIWYREYPALGKLLINRKYSEIIYYFMLEGCRENISEYNAKELMNILSKIKNKLPAFYKNMVKRQIAHLTLLLI